MLWQLFHMEKNLGEVANDLDRDQSSISDKETRQVCAFFLTVRIRIFIWF